MSLTFITQIVARVILLVQVVLGVIVWTGHGDSLVPVHTLVGLLLVLDLWAAIALGLRAGVPIGLAILALVWSVGMPVFGLVQTKLLTGDLHVIIEVLHLIVGVAAVGLVEALTRRRRPSPKLAA